METGSGPRSGGTSADDLMMKTWTNKNGPTTGSGGWERKYQEVSTLVGGLEHFFYFSIDWEE